MAENNNVANVEEVKNRAIQNKYDFRLIFDVENGNPNGDPDADNLPRTDPETSIGLVTPTCMKYKIRQSVIRDTLYGEKKNEAGNFRIMMRPDEGAINDKLAVAYKETDMKPKGNKCTKEEKNKATEWLLERYWDIRAFGGVYNTGEARANSVLGPVSLTFAKSVDPVLPTQLSGIRCVRTEASSTADNTIMKSTLIPYGLYIADGHVDACVADKTHFTEEDLEVLWRAIEGMFENTYSASRGKIVLRKLIIFKHDTPLGNAFSEDLFNKVKVELKEGVDVPRSYSDYNVTIDKTEIKGVEIIERV